VTRWAILVGALVLAGTGCAHRQERALRRASRDLSKSVARGDAEGVRSAVVPGGRAVVDTRAMLSGAQKKRWSKALRRPLEAEPRALVFVAPDQPIEVVLTPEGWRFAEDPTDVYAQDSPRHALRALVLASRHHRWDVLVDLAPKRYRIGLSADDLERAWTEGEHAEVLAQSVEAIAQHLSDPIVADAHEAVLEIDPSHVVRLEREGDRWVVVDFVPQT
jgi:hypothetical protein